MSRSMLRHAFILGCSSLALALPVSAAAQEAANDTVNDNEIIVKATRHDEKLQNVAMAVNVATGDQLEKLKIFDVKDVSQLAPGLELTNTTGRNNTTTLRGITFDPDQGTAPAVQVYLNEIPTDAQTAYTAVYDIQQIEVLRGPQGLLRGLSAPAGSITIATRKPNFDQVEGYAQATATDRHGYNVQAGVSLPFSDKLAIRVAGLVDGNRLNQVHDVNLNNEHSLSSTESARITLGWKPSSDFTAYLTYQYLTADNRQFQQVIGSGNYPAYQALAYAGGYAVPDTSERSGPALGASDYGAVQEGAFRSLNTTHIVNLQFDYDLGPATLSFVGAHQFSKLTISRDQDSANAVPDYISNSKVVTPYKVDTAELRLSSNNKEGLGWGIGAFYQKQTGTTVVDQRQDFFITPFTVDNPIYAAVPSLFPYTPASAHIEVPVNNQTWSFNGNLRYKTGGLTIEGGLRYTISKAVQTADIFVTQTSGTTLYPGIPTDIQSRTYHPLTGGVTIDYKILPSMNAYFSYGHSYRAGSAAVGTPYGISNDLVLTKPEKTDSFEAGLKGTLAHRRLSYTLSAYYQKIDNFLSRFTSIYYTVQATQQTGGFDFNYNGNATVKGIEASLDGRLSDNWDFGVSGAYSHARWDNARLPCNDYAGTGSPNASASPAITGSGDVSYCNINGRLANTPDFSLSANTEIRFPMDKFTPFVRALFTYRPGFYSWQSDYNYQDNEMLNLFVGLRGSNSSWEITAFAKNLLNQQRITNISLGNAMQSTYCGVGYSPCGNNAGLPYNSGYRTVNVTNPREFGVTISTKW